MRRGEFSSLCHGLHFWLSHIRPSKPRTQLPLPSGPGPESHPVAALGPGCRLTDVSRMCIPLHHRGGSLGPLTRTLTLHCESKGRAAAVEGSGLVHPFFVALPKPACTERGGSSSEGPKRSAIHPEVSPPGETELPVYLHEPRLHLPGGSFFPCSSLATSGVSGEKLVLLASSTAFIVLPAGPAPGLSLLLSAQSAAWTYALELDVRASPGLRRGRSLTKEDDRTGP